MASVSELFKEYQKRGGTKSFSQFRESVLEKKRQELLWKQDDIDIEMENKRNLRRAVFQHKLQVDAGRAVDKMKAKQDELAGITRRKT